VLTPVQRLKLALFTDGLTASDEARRELSAGVPLPRAPQAVRPESGESRTGL